MSRYKKIIIVFSIAVLMVSFFAVSKALAKDIIFDPGTDNVGIGTASPFEKLTISGESTIGGYPTISLINTTIPREWHFWPINGGDLRFRDDTAGIDIMTFEGGTGSVGINNNDPVYRLDVNGTGRFTSPLIVATPTDSNHATTKSYVDSSVIGDTTCDGSTCNVTNTGTLDGFSATSASTPSTIAARNSSGDINARLFKSEYDNTNGSVNYIMTQIDTVSNNYIRPSTPAQVAADLHTSLDSYLITGVTAGNQLTGGGTSGTVTLNVSEGSGSGLDADYVDGLHAYRFLRSDASDTFTASSLTLDSGAYLKTRMIGSLGTELGIGAGEMWSTMNGNITGETLWLGGESGVKIVSSPDNMSSGWTGRHEASLVNTAGDSTFPGDVTADAFYYNSDKRLKDNIVSLGSESLAVIDKLNPVSFTWKEDGTASQGFIAQEIEQVLPELVRADEASGMKSVQYANLTAVLTAGMKTQQEKINDLETELEILKIQLNSLKNN